MNKRYSILIAACLAVGCAPATLGDLRRDGVTVTFGLPQQYQAVLYKAVQFQKDCFTGSFAASALTVQSELYPDLRTGSVTVNFTNLGDRPRVFMHTDVRHNAVDGATEVTISAADIGIWPGRAQILRAHLERAAPCQ